VPHKRQWSEERTELPGVRLQGGGYKARRQPGGRQLRNTQGFGMCFCFGSGVGVKAQKP